MKYKSDGRYQVTAGKKVIAKSYVGCNLDPNRAYSVRILQGMPRKLTIIKICGDCPEFASQNDINENYHPLLFSK
jgi:hypothetical protein